MFVFRSALVLLSFLLSTSSYANWSAIVLSDIHVYKDGTLERNFLELVNCLAPLNAKFVFVTGDSTNGNKDDGVSSAKATMWWSSLKASLKPLSEAGAEIYPVAGNHDYYDPVHQQAYKKAWAELAGSPARDLNGNAPLYYSFDYDGVHFALAHVVTQRLEKPVRQWLESDLGQAAGARARFVFGHVPFSTVLGEKVPQSFKNDLGGLLATNRVDAYVAGHEHLVWDEYFEINDSRVRQVIVGTASASYNFPLSKRTYKAHCAGARCRMPATGGNVWLTSEKSRRQINERAFGLISSDENGVRLELKAFRPSKPARGDRIHPEKISAFGCDGEIVAFE